MKDLHATISTTQTEVSQKQGTYLDRHCPRVSDRQNVQLE